MKTWTNPTVEELEIKETAWFAWSNSKEYCSICGIWGTPSCGGDHGNNDHEGENPIPNPNPDDDNTDDGYGES